MSNVDHRYFLILTDLGNLTKSCSEVHITPRIWVFCISPTLYPFLKKESKRENPGAIKKALQITFSRFSDDKEVVCVDEEKQSKGTIMKAKLLQFHENYRPAYYGTWRKNSKLITARKPLGQDKVTPLDSVTFL